MVLSLIDICSLSVLLQLVFGYVFVAGSCPIHHLISFPQLSFFRVIDRAMRDRLLSFPSVTASSPSLLELYLCFISPFS
uniref:Uncharacterized protein n=1 Tax=Brassica oleracea TaxID=3712 RepID=A0A3P6C094_BRAOL|nr:unnamed protein product [Brassica oleracea]